MRRGVPAEVREALDEAQELGWLIKFGGKHIKCTHPQGGCVVVSVSPSSTTYIKKKIMADIRREGAKWKHTQRKS